MASLMGNYSVPDHIMALKPKGTIVKKINHRFYVYEYKYLCDANGNCHKDRQEYLHDARRYWVHLMITFLEIKKSHI